MTNPPLGIFLLVGSQALSYIRQWRSAFGIALKLTASINQHGAFPKIDRWSSRIQIRERTLQDRRSLEAKLALLGFVGKWYNGIQ